MALISPRLVDEAIEHTHLLNRVDVDALQFDENWLQALLFKKPDLLPTAEIDPAFKHLIPLAREFPVTSGSVDVLYTTPDGRLCLVETKLWRNPEAHRTVLAQLLDYAKDMVRLDYAEFKTRIESIALRHAYPPSLDRIVQSHVSANSFDAIQFEQGIRRSLATGNFLLLIVGDRIRPEVALLSDILGTAPHVEFSLALIDMNFYHLSAKEKWPVLVIPTIIGRSHEVTRAVVRIRYEQKPPEVEVAAAEGTSVSPNRTGLELFVKDLPSDLQDVYRVHLESWMTGPLVLYWGKSGFSLRFASRGKFYTIIDGQPTYISVVTEKYLP